MIILTDKQVNLGLMILQLEKYAKIIKKEIDRNNQIKDTLKLSEREMTVMIKELKNQMFKNAEFVKI